MGTGELQMKTIVIGDLMLDKYVFGIVERVSPESGCPILTNYMRISIRRSCKCCKTTKKVRS